MAENEFEHRLKSMEPRSIRYTDEEWAAFEEIARRRGMAVSTIVRHLSRVGLKIVLSQEELEEYGRVSKASFRITA